MRILFGVLFSLVLAVSGPAGAGEACPTADLSADPRNPVRLLPVEDQHGTDMCYAYTSAFVANAYILKTAQYSAPIFTPAVGAMLVNREARGITTDVLGGGQADWVLGAMSRRGHVCSKLQMETRLQGLMRAGNFTDMGKLLDFLGAKTYVNKWAPAAKLPYCVRNRNPAAAQWLEAHDMARFSQVDVLRSAIQGCPSSHYELPQPKSAHNLNDVATQALINRNLSRGFPVEASLACYDRFARTSSDARAVRTTLPRTETPDCVTGKHSIALTGQKVINGQCHYQIRNTLGALWRGPGATYCSCIDRQNNYVENCPARNAKKILGCWYTRDHVMGHLYGANGLL